MKKNRTPSRRLPRNKRSKTTERRPNLLEQGERNDAFEVLRRMRRNRESLAHAARQVQIAPRKVLRHVGKALVKRRNRYRARPGDQLVRTLKFVTSDKGQTDIRVRGSRKASLVGEYFSAVERYLLTGDPDTLQVFAGKSIRVGKDTYPFITDFETLELLSYAGQFQFEDLYILK